MFMESKNTTNDTISNKRQQGSIAKPASNSKPTPATDNESFTSSGVTPAGLQLLHAYAADESIMFFQQAELKGSTLKERFCRHGKAIRKNPLIVMIPLLIFILLLTSCIVVISTTAKAQDDQLANEARLLAIETGEVFADSLDLAIAPLFSLAQFVKQLMEFNDLADEIGPAGVPGSAPFMPSLHEDGIPTHRNVSGICDDPTTLKRFNDIAAAIKESAKMEKILVNLQLAPHAVVCMAYPLNNTEDFDDGVYMDNSGIIGHDLLEDPARSFIAQATVPSDNVVIAGPLSLRQCSDCDPTVKQAFIARLPIASKSHVITVDGTPYEKWGFAVALINWDGVVEKSNLQESFAQRGFSFRLTRTDQIEDPETGTFIPKVVTLTESPNYEDGGKYTVSTDMKTTNNDWRITINYSEAAETRWRPWAFAISFFFAMSFTILAYMVLLQKQVHSDMDEEKTNLLATHARQAAANQRDLNEFLAHEVRNPLSAALSACTFVTYALQENSSAKEQNATKSSAPHDEEAPRPESSSEKTVDEFEEERTKLTETVSEDVHIIETSLRFINELLRSILDINRATNNQMVLEKDEIDVCHDLFEPVSSMIYKRDSGFEFLIECPENLIIETDRLRLQQVILNLCRNSAKFVTSGYVRVRAEVRQAHEKSEARQVLLFVEDSGPGIPEEKREHMFRRFQESLDSLGQGTGVGLNLCKKIVDLMGGSIYFDETFDSGIPGSPGTRIVIELPQDVPEMHSATITATEKPTVDRLESKTSLSTVFYDELPYDLTATNNNSLTTTSSTEPSETGPVATLPAATPSAATTIPDGTSVLFVDDDRVLRKLASRALTKALPTCVIREAASGETALTVVESQDFDIIFMDQYMTSVDQALKGTETIRAMRAKGVKSLICGLSANDIESSFLSSGADAFLLKPFPCKSEEVLEAVQRIWQLRESTGADKVAPSTVDPVEHV